MKKVIRFWLDKGVDGFRCDAVPFLFEREGTSCENLPETHLFFKDIRQMINEYYPDSILLAEANVEQDELLEYFGNGDEFHMALNSSLAPAFFLALAEQNVRPIVNTLNRLMPIPENSSWTTYLRNHDEMGLIIENQKDRDMLYSVYAPEPKMRWNRGVRRRLAPLLSNDRNKIELMYSLLFAMPGNPIIYYGDEIGMGDNVYLPDRNGIRTPMQWNADRNAGFSRADPEQVVLPVILNPIYHYKAVNVDANERIDTSLLSFLKKMITVRKNHIAFSRGSLEIIETTNRKVLALIREYKGEVILAIFNLSDNAQFAQLDLKQFNKMKLIEVIGQTFFPAIMENSPYYITLYPNSFFWFQIKE